MADIAHQMDGNPGPKYKEVHGLMRRVDAKRALLCLSRTDAPLVICDATETARPQARRLDYVGRLRDGRTRGFRLSLLAALFRGLFIRLKLKIPLPGNVIRRISSDVLCTFGSGSLLDRRQALGQAVEQGLEEMHGLVSGAFDQLDTWSRVGPLAG
jgi:hypothetical protein